MRFKWRRGDKRVGARISRNEGHVTQPCNNPVYCKPIYLQIHFKIKNIIKFKIN